MTPFLMKIGKQEYCLMRNWYLKYQYDVFFITFNLRARGP